MHIKVIKPFMTSVWFKFVLLRYDAHVNLISVVLLWKYETRLTGPGSQLMGLETRLELLLPMYINFHPSMDK